MFLRYAYVVFIGVLLAAFVGVGVATFYQGPQPPEYKSYPKVARPVAEQPTEEEIAYQEEMDKKYKEFSEKDREYQRNVSIINLSAAILILILSLLVIKNVPVISDGALLGGVLLLLYSIVKGFGTDDNYYRFIVTSVGLLIALTLGYLKFVRSSK